MGDSAMSTPASELPKLITEKALAPRFPLLDYKGSPKSKIEFPDTCQGTQVLLLQNAEQAPTLLASARKGSIHIWDIEHRTHIKSLDNALFSDNLDLDQISPIIQAPDYLGYVHREHLSGALICSLIQLSNGYLVSGNLYGIIAFWDTGTAKCVKIINVNPDTNKENFEFLEVKENSYDKQPSYSYLPFPVRTLLQLSDHYILSNSSNYCGHGQVDIWEIESGKHVKRLTDRYFHTLEKLPNNRLAASEGNEIVILDLETGKQMKPSFTEHQRPVRVLTSLFNGYLISGSEDNTVKIWDVKTGDCLQSLSHKQSIVAAIELPGNRLACGEASEGFGWTYHVYIWDLKTYKLLSKTSPTTSSILSLAKFPDGRIAYACRKNPVGILDFYPVEPDTQEHPSAEELTLQEHKWQVARFNELLENPKKIVPHTLHEMFERVDNVVDFKLPYTLACIGVVGDLENETGLGNELITEVKIGLELLADRCMFNNQCIAIYEAILCSARDKKFISQMEFYALESKAQTNSTLNDPRFQRVLAITQHLQAQVDANRENIQRLGDDLSQLKKALEAKAKRDMLVGIASSVFAFFGGQLLSSLSSLVDLSNFYELGSSLFKCDISVFMQYCAQGMAALQNNMKPATQIAIEKMVCNPEALLKLWTQENLLLQPTPVAPIPYLGTGSSSRASSANPGLVGLFRPTAIRPQDSAATLLISTTWQRLMPILSTEPSEQWRALPMQDNASGEKQYNLSITLSIDKQEVAMKLLSLIETQLRAALELTAYREGERASLNAIDVKQQTLTESIQLSICPVTENSVRLLKQIFEHVDLSHIAQHQTTPAPRPALLP
jgi:WD40 repeat protein